MARNFWTCNVCHAQNSVVDGTCQFCECRGAKCQRDNCDDPRHFAVTEGEIAQEINP